jgi:fatty-acyl-CoA synthase
VAEAAVLAIPHPRWQERPLMVVVRRGDVSAEALRDFLAGLVPKWWLPDQIVFVKELPHGPTGKLAKNVLRDWMAEGRIG